MRRLKCPVCLKKAKFIFKTKDKRINSEEIFYLFRCAQCDIEFINKPRKPLSSYYQEDYFDTTFEDDTLFKLKKSIIEKYYASNKIQSLLFRPLINFIAVLPKEKGKIVDIGCGAGDVLMLLKQVGFDVHGIEISKFATKAANEKGLTKVICGDDTKLKTYPDKYFDYIRISHVIEHLSDPLDFIRVAHLKLKKKGSLLIATPNINSFGRIFGRHAKYYSDIPRHLILFSNKSLPKLLKNAGFTKIEISYFSMFSDFKDNLFLYLENKFNFSNKAFTRLKYNLIINFLFLPIDFLSYIFSLGQTMSITAEK